MSVFETKKTSSSVIVAKDRLKTLLVSDRVNDTPDARNRIENELYKTISKYFEIDKKQFQVDVTRSTIHIRYTGEDS